MAGALNFQHVVGIALGMDASCNPFADADAIKATHYLCICCLEMAGSLGEIKIVTLILIRSILGLVSLHHLANIPDQQQGFI